MSTEYVSSDVVLEKIKRHRSVLVKRSRHKHIRTLILDNAVYGLGSGPNGAPIIDLHCGNVSSRGQILFRCPNPGLLTCSKCSLIKYCSPRCQMQHSSYHHIICDDVFLQGTWRPQPMTKQPSPADSKTVRTNVSNPHIIWSNSPAIDCLQLEHNEAIDANSRDFRLCFAAAPDILNAVRTVNSLPQDYKGKCNILLNNVDPIVMNRNLLILYVLLSPGPSFEESAELAVHLMYSTMLTPAAAVHLKHCIHLIYGAVPQDGKLSFQRSLDTRGYGKLYSMQLTTAIKRPLEMFRSSYNGPEASNSVRAVLLNSNRSEQRDNFFASLRPAHRIAFSHFWSTGILAPFSSDVSELNEPNRLTFSAQGDWLGHPEFNPLRGWNVSDVLQSGAKHNLESADILGCLFFHLKDELKEFAIRIKQLHINIYLTQFDAKILTRGITIGALPAFDGGQFDRIDLSTMMDEAGLESSLVGWGPLLNKENQHACMIMRSEKWYITQPKATARTNPRILDLLRRKYESIPLKRATFTKLLTQDMRSPVLYRLVHSLDVFLDHESAFHEYLQQQNSDVVLKKLRLRLRKTHQVHPKRYGIPLDLPNRKVPEVSREEFYNIFTLGGAEFPVRFVEIEKDRAEVAGGCS
ncbi:hypothetical protein AMATHDRAFT_138007 [Amanita thiersii Skay4041]|uniref:MYND-type domain-containing protein n=1 Tax=Amanita thiersii Skay4041 TaxID=703135 RepID=A0A2A9NZA8_9AGAR|nr:hypothetical protein AMATHDRAFT_138007 [Amanita thiersii Skay4041]